jgi:protein NrfD
VTGVFFLFLLHFAVGLLLALLFVPARAGDRFFRLTAGAAATMLTFALWLAYRRYGLAGGLGAPGAASYPLVAGLVLLSLVLVVAFNRAWRFDWSAVRLPALLGALAAGLWAMLLLAPTPLVAAADLTSALLLGAAAAAMILGHYYLVVLDLPIAALRRLTVLLAVAVFLRVLTVGLVLVGPVHAGYEEARLVASGLWSADGVFVWMRVLFGLAGPISLLWFVWKTVEIRSTQSATGILYVQLFLVLAGELLAKYLRVAAGFPL